MSSLTPRPSRMWSPNDNELKEMADTIAKAGVERLELQGTRRFHSFDFLAGAMATYFAMGLQGSIPADWVFLAFQGRDPIRERLARKRKEVEEYRGPG